MAVLVSAAVLIGTAGFSATAVGAAQPATDAASGPHGTLSVLQTASSWPTLDPATDNQDALDDQLLNAIYGGLFEFGPQGKVIPDLASAYSLTNGNKTLTITIRSGVRFANGTALTAADVVASIKRDLLPANGCICDADFAAVSTITSSGSNVIFHMSTPDTAIVRAFEDTAPNWPIPMSLVKTAAAAKKFEQLPVGAGPFGKVVHNTASAEVTLDANPYYWQKGKPKLASLTYTSVGSDESAYASLETGQSQVALTVETIPVIESAKKSTTVKVLSLPATFFEFIAFNTKIPPFNNKKARLALLYATNDTQLVKALYAGLYTPTEGPTAPGALFYRAKIPGYPTYNLAKAKALVKQLGGLSFKLATTENTTYWTTEASYLSGMWSKAGIDAKVDATSLTELLELLKSGNWSGVDSNWGGLDPGVALPTYFASTGPFSGVHNAGLDALMNEGISTANSAARAKIYLEIDEDMAKNAWADFLYSKPFFDFITHKVQGISSNQTDIFWQNVSLK